LTEKFLKRYFLHIVAIIALATSIHSTIEQSNIIDTLKKQNSEYRYQNSVLKDACIDFLEKLEETPTSPKKEDVDL
jgi:hypothetical protein